MALVRYIQFQTQGQFTEESFTTFGVNKHVIDPVGEDISGDQQYIYPTTAGIRNIRGRVQGPKKFSGPIDCPLYPTHATTLLYYALGSVTYTPNTPNTSVNTHLIKKSEQSLPIFRAGIGRQLNEHRYVGGIMNGFTVDYSPDELLTASFDTIFRRELTLGTLDTTASFIDYDDVDRAYGGTEVCPEIDTVQVSYVESCSISVENNIADDAYALCSPYLSGGVIGNLNVSGSMDLRYDANTRYTDWLDGTKAQLELLAQRGTGANVRNVDFNMPVISYDTNRLPTDGFERYVQTVDFTCEPDGNGDPILVSVVNALDNTQFAG